MIRRGPFIGRQNWRLCLLLPALLATSPLRADRFAESRELSWSSIQEDSLAFFAKVLVGASDDNGDRVIDEIERASGLITRYAVLAALLLGASCGLLGSFVTLKRMALFGDMLGHAVLPGIALGFIFAGEKSTPALLGGALLAGFAAAGFTRAIRSWSRLKEDAALGISLSLFYALGIWLLAYITRHPVLSAESSGLDAYLFGNPAIVRGHDLWALGITCAVVVGLVTVGYKELLAFTFDPGFSASLGWSRGAIDALLLGLLTVVVVVSLKILGVVLVVAMLTIPPATAHLLTDHFRYFTWLSTLLAMAAAFVGVWLSVVLRIGAGPSIVCVAFSGLVLAFLFSPAHGLLGRWLGQLRLERRIGLENLLAASYRIRERDERPGWEFSLEELAHERSDSPHVPRLAQRLARRGWAELVGNTLRLTARGAERARRVVRIHRLWELFLIEEANLPHDHVHPGAEDIEHLLDDEALEELERHLDHPSTDPHGKDIPDVGGALEPDDRAGGAAS